MINVALLGFGRIGQMHAQNIYLNKTLNLLYVYEKINKLRKKAQNLYNCKIEKNYKKIFSDEKVDIIFISSPTNTHIRFIEEGIKYNKTIICEKPLDLNINKIVKTLKKVKKNNSKIQMGFNRRFDPSHYSIKKDLEKGKIGRLEKIIITSRDPAPPSKTYLRSSGGIFRDMMIHNFDLCRYYLNNDEILAVAYQYTVGGQVYQVGEFANDGIDATTLSSQTGQQKISNNSLILKLLKSSITNVNQPVLAIQNKAIVLVVPTLIYMS